MKTIMNKLRIYVYTHIINSYYYYLNYVRNDHYVNIHDMHYIPLTLIPHCYYNIGTYYSKHIYCLVSQWCWCVSTILSVGFFF